MVCSDSTQQWQPLQSEFFLLLGIDLFLAISLLSCLLDKHLPWHLPYLYQVAALAGFGQLIVNKEFTPMFGDYMRFWFSLNALPKSGERIFGQGAYVADSLENMLISARKRLASSFCNPRLLRIHFHTLHACMHHWAITNYAHKVKDPFLVQQFSIHKDIQCVMKYVHYKKVIYQTSENDGWTVRAARNAEEAIELLKVGFDYVTDFDGVRLFRKRK